MAQANDNLCLACQSCSGEQWASKPCRASALTQNTEVAPGCLLGFRTCPDLKSHSALIGQIVRRGLKSPLVCQRASLITLYLTRRRMQLEQRRRTVFVVAARSMRRLVCSCGSPDHPLFYPALSCSCQPKPSSLCCCGHLFAGYAIHKLRAALSINSHVSVAGNEVIQHPSLKWNRLCRQCSAGTHSPQLGVT